MLARSILGLVASCVLATAAAAQVPYLVADINQLGAASRPEDFIELGGVALFQATDGATGAELWRSDGTAAGTVLVKDICPGPCGSATAVPAGPSEPPPTFARIAALGRVFFAADDGTSGWELWVTDGTTAGTSLLLDICPGDCGSASFAGHGLDAAVLGPELFFLASDDQGDQQLWRTDGTTVGTRPVLSAPMSQAMDLVALGGSLYFIGRDGAGTDGIFASDGTGPGTVLAVPLAAGQTNSLFAGAGRLYFQHRATDRQIWSSDGTPAGTFPILTLRSPRDHMEEIIASGSHVFFHVEGALPGLWATDGTPAGTVELVSGSGLVDLDGIAYFSASDPATGGELWKSDGTLAGTMLACDVVPGPGSSNPYGLVAGGGLLHFIADDAAGQAGLWRSDGTQAGTRRVTAVPEDGWGQGPDELGWAAGRLFLAVPERHGIRQLWTSDGTATGTVGITINDSTADSSPAGNPVGGSSPFFAIEDLVGFRAYDGVAGTQPWVSDGTGAGTTRLGDRSTGWNSTFLGLVRGGLLLAMDDVLTGVELWRSDGTAAGTSLLLDLRTGAGSSSPAWLARLGHTALLAATDDAAGREIWTSDGTGSGTGLLGDFCPGACSFDPTPMVAYGGWLVFAGNDGSSGSELWRTDGTAAGTTLVADIRPGVEGSSPGGFSAGPGGVYFDADDGQTGRELWRTDGTAAGTRLVADLEPGPDPSSPGELTSSGGSLYFIASVYSFMDPHGLWRTDGTASGTELMHAWSSPNGPRGLADAAGTLFFLAGCETWTSDGSIAGTRQVCPGCVRFPSGDTGICPSEMVTAGDRAYFRGSTDAAGSELWVTDGTPAGTTMIADIRPGGSSGPSHLTVVGDRLFFSADGVEHGRELWALDIGLRASAVLLRNDDASALDPLTPPRASLLPLDTVRDAYRTIASGSIDPELGIVLDARRPVVFYALDGPGTLHLAKTEDAFVRIVF